MDTLFVILVALVPIVLILLIGVAWHMGSADGTECPVCKSKNIDYRPHEMTEDDYGVYWMDPDTGDTHYDLTQGALFTEEDTDCTCRNCGYQWTAKGRFW